MPEGSSDEELRVMAARLTERLAEDKLIAEQISGSSSHLADTAWEVAEATEAKLKAVLAEILRRQGT